MGSTHTRRRSIQTRTAAAIVLALLAWVLLAWVILALWPVNPITSAPRGYRRPKGDNLLVFEGHLAQSRLRFPQQRGLYALDLDSGRLTRWVPLTRWEPLTYWNHTVSWSQTKEQFLYDQLSAIGSTFLISSDGTVKQSPIFRHRNARDYTLSPSGNQVAFVYQDALHIQNTDGTGLQRTIEHVDWSGPDWSPDGRYITVVARRPDGLPGDALYRIESDGSNPTPLTGELEIRLKGTLDTHHQWSPDGSKIALAYDSSASGGDGHFVLIDMESREIRQLYPTDRGTVYKIAWSPDGTKIAFNYIDQTENTPDPGKRYGLWITDSDGSEFHQVSPPSLSWHWDFAWSPDSTQLAFEQKEYTSTALVLVDTNSDETRKVWSAQLDGPGQGISELAWTPDGDDLVLCAALNSDDHAFPWSGLYWSGHTGNIYILDIEQRNLVRQTNLWLYNARDFTWIHTP